MRKEIDIGHWLAACQNNEALRGHVRNGNDSERARAPVGVMGLSVIYGPRVCMECSLWHLQPTPRVYEYIRLPCTWDCCVCWRRPNGGTASDGVSIVVCARFCSFTWQRAMRAGIWDVGYVLDSTTSAMQVAWRARACRSEVK